MRNPESVFTNTENPEKSPSKSSSRVGNFQRTLRQTILLALMASLPQVLADDKKNQDQSQRTKIVTADTGEEYGNEEIDALVRNITTAELEEYKEKIDDAKKESPFQTPPTAEGNKDEGQQTFVPDDKDQPREPSEPEEEGVKPNMQKKKTSTPSLIPPRSLSYIPPVSKPWRLR